jgi:fused signal recognition particle receptor
VLKAEVGAVPRSQPPIAARATAARLSLASTAPANTTISKLAARAAARGHSACYAGDTFRAAAIDQLEIWAERAGCSIVTGNVGSDAAGLVFDALEQARAVGADVLLVDTAGRLQNKDGLGGARQVTHPPSTRPRRTMPFCPDAMKQNARRWCPRARRRYRPRHDQLDGTARGILVAIAAKHALPVHLIGIGEGQDDLQPFDAGEFAQAIAAG